MMTNFIIFPIIIPSTSPKLKDECMYTSTTPTRFHGVYTETTSPSKTDLHGEKGSSDKTQE
jgi:hypothetical protein